MESIDGSTMMMKTMSMMLMLSMGLKSERTEKDVRLKLNIIENMIIC